MNKISNIYGNNLYAVNKKAEKKQDTQARKWWIKAAQQKLKQEYSISAGLGKQGGVRQLCKEIVSIIPWLKGRSRITILKEFVGGETRKKHYLQSARVNAAEKASSAKFLESYEWRRLRMEVLKKYGRRCMCCGATPDNGVTMHVDHIKPRRKYPELALAISNLQVLCEVCNHGKGNWDETDWRPKKERLPEGGAEHMQSITGVVH